MLRPVLPSPNNPSVEQPRPPALLPLPQPSKLDAELTTSTVAPLPAAPAAAPAAKPTPAPPAAQPTPAAAAPPAAKPAPAAAASVDSEAGDKISTHPAAPAAGGAAILAKLRAQREAKAAAGRGAAAKEVVVLYASQTGTAQEIARGIQAEAESQGLKAKVRRHRWGWRA